MLNHYKRILKDTDKRVEHSLKIQVKKKGDPHEGGFADQNGLVHAKYAIYRITTAIAAYCNEESFYCKDKAVKQMILNGLEFIRRSQHDNGLFDYIDCNFYSAPDTGFCIKRLLPVFHYLEKHGESADRAEIFRQIKTIIIAGAEGMKTGGFHTPNHRWAIASNLMECGYIFKDEEMKQQAKRYLNEGLDCNEDGEYAEKSSGNYNRINNDAMITLGAVTGNEIYYDCAVRNLKLMLTYLEPDGSIFTANSTRQDNGKKIYPRDYYMQYLEMGYGKNITEFLDTANFIFDLIEENGLLSPDALIQFMNHPEFINVEHEGVYGIPEYTRYYKDSGILRVNKKEYGYTLLKGKSGFLHFSTKTLHLQLKVCGSFFRHKSFEPEILQRTDRGWQLNQSMTGWYYLPLEEKQDTSDWWKMDHGKREMLTGPDLEVKAELIEVDNGIDLHIKAWGTKDAPFRIEAEIVGSELLTGDQFAIATDQGRSMVLKSGDAVFSNDKESVLIGPGFGTHLYTSGRFGSETKSEHAFTLYFTDYTEFDHIIHIRIGDREE
jgi:hypothetical protein